MADRRTDAGDRGLRSRVQTTRRTRRLFWCWHCAYDVQERLSMGDEVLTEAEATRLKEYKAERAKEIAELQALWPVTWLREAMIDGAHSVIDTHSVLDDHTGWS